MKILHTADWHIGKRLDRFSRIEEQRDVLAEITAIAEKESVDLVLVAGDLYDAVNPGSEAEELLYRGLVDLSGNGTRPVVAIAGNHDSPDRINAPDVLARLHGITLVGYPAAIAGTIKNDTFIADSIAPGVIEIRWKNGGVPPARLIVTPYANENRLRSAVGIDAEATDGEPAPPVDRDRALAEVLRLAWRRVADEHLGERYVNLLLTHLFFAADPGLPPEEPESERPIGHTGGAPALPADIVPSAVQYAACGHLHRPHTLPGSVPVRYAGSPLSYSFSEAEQEKTVTIVEVEGRGNLGDTPEIREIPLRSGYPLRRHTATAVEKGIEWLEENQECYVELTLDLEEYLTGDDRNRLHKSHPRLVSLIPRLAQGDRMERIETIDPTGDIRTLFAQYFTRTHGIPPGQDVTELFEEVLEEAGR